MFIHALALRHHSPSRAEARARWIRQMYLVIHLHMRGGVWGVRAPDGEERVQAKVSGEGFGVGVCACVGVSACVPCIGSVRLC